MSTHHPLHLGGAALQQRRRMETYAQYGQPHHDLYKAVRDGTPTGTDRALWLTLHAHHHTEALLLLDGTFRSRDTNVALDVWRHIHDRARHPDSRLTELAQVHAPSPLLGVLWWDPVQAWIEASIWPHCRHRSLTVRRLRRFWAERASHPQYRQLRKEAR